MSDLPASYNGHQRTSYQPLPSDHAATAEVTITSDGVTVHQRTLTRADIASGGPFHWHNPSYTTSKCEHWRANGTLKTWKRASNAHRIELPVAFGMYRFGTLTHLDIGSTNWHLASECTIPQPKR